MTQLSQHFTLEEAIDSDTAKQYNIDNRPMEDGVLGTMKVTAAYMEIVRALLKQPVHVNSWYRCLQLNRQLGSKDTSQHRTGEAVDFICPAFGTPVVIVKKLQSLFPLIPYDQLILEHTWVHISFSVLKSQPKGQILSLLHDNRYAVGITDINGRPL